jgi:hypothetical protein
MRTYELKYASGGWCPAYYSDPMDPEPNPNVFPADPKVRISIPLNHPDYLRLCYVKIRAKIRKTGSW